MFSQAMKFISKQNHGNGDDIDEDQVQNDHDQAYNKGNASNMSSQALGSAAAMNALKSFSGSNSSNNNNGGGGDMKSKAMAMAMAQAAKLFDQSGGSNGGTKNVNN